MEESVFQLHPSPVREAPLRGLYLAHNLRQCCEQAGQIFVIANFVSSLDGRIAIKPSQGSQTIPDQTANARDWRLFQELAVQADLLITTGRYLRDYAEGNAQDILRVYDDPGLADLKDWRIDNGLKPYPDLAVISGSLDFPIPQEMTAEDRRVLIFTGRSADPGRVRTLESQVGEVIAVGDRSVSGPELRGSLSDLGYGVVYSTAGPKVHHLLLRAGVLDRLYLTLAHRVLGGEVFSSIVEGPMLDPAGEFRLATLYYDADALEGLGQLFLSYDVARTGGDRQHPC